MSTLFQKASGCRTLQPDAHEVISLSQLASRIVRLRERKLPLLRDAEFVPPKPRTWKSGRKRNIKVCHWVMLSLMCSFLQLTTPKNNEQQRTTNNSQQQQQQQPQRQQQQQQQQHQQHQHQCFV